MSDCVQIHWFSIINSCVTVLLLTGFLATILLRVLKNDFIKFMRDEEAGARMLVCVCVCMVCASACISLLCSFAVRVQLCCWLGCWLKPFSLALNPTQQQATLQTQAFFWRSHIFCLSTSGTKGFTFKCFPVA